MSSELDSGMAEYEVGIRYQLSFRIWMKQSYCLSQASLPEPRLALLAPLPMPLDNISPLCQKAHRSAHHTLTFTATPKHTQTQRTYKYYKQT